MVIQKILSVGLVGFVLNGGVAFASDVPKDQKHILDGAGAGNSLGSSDQCEAEASAKDHELIANFDKRLAELEPLKSKGGGEYALALDKLTNEYSSQLSQQAQTFLLAKINQKRLVDLAERLNNDEKFAKEYLDIQDKLQAFTTHFEKLKTALEEQRKVSFAQKAASGIFLGSILQNEFQREFEILSKPVIDSAQAAHLAISNSSLDQETKTSLVRALLLTRDSMFNINRANSDDYILGLEKVLAGTQLTRDASVAAFFIVGSMTLGGTTTGLAAGSTATAAASAQALFYSLASDVAGRTGRKLASQAVADVFAMSEAALKGEDMFCALMAQQQSPDRTNFSKALASSIREKVFDSLGGLVGGGAAKAKPSSKQG